MKCLIVTSRHGLLNWYPTFLLYAFSLSVLDLQFGIQLYFCNAVFHVVECGLEADQVSNFITRIQALSRAPLEKSLPGLCRGRLFLLRRGDEVQLFDQGHRFDLQPDGLAGLDGQLVGGAAGQTGDQRRVPDPDANQRQPGMFIGL